MKLKKCTWFALTLAASVGCDDGGGGGSSVTGDSAAPVQRGDAAAQQDSSPPTVDCDEAPNGTPCGTPGSGKHCVLEACVKNSCGDGIIVDEDNEACDDGNEDDGDGCSARCAVESPDAGDDAGQDAGDDAGQDAGDDAGQDAGDDAGQDAATDSDASTGMDAASDASALPDAAHAPDAASPDAAPDAAADAGSDAALEAGDDAGGSDAGHEHDAASEEGGIPAITCAACADTHCRDYMGANLVAGCFTAVSPDFGANPADPNFIQDCTDTVACARQRGCGFTAQFQAQDCYCGSNAGDACTASGPAADAPCLAEWQHATRSTVNTDVLNRFSDLAYPAGWAYFLIDCYRSSCSSPNTGNCTVP